jgi:hypothetical protein
LPIIFDNIESYDNPVREVLKNSFNKKCRPIIMTSDDIFTEPAKSFSKFCVVVKLEQPKVSFISKCIKAKVPLIDAKTLQSIFETADGNLSSAINCITWIKQVSAQDAGHQCFQDCTSMYLDVPMDVPKATRAALLGQNIPLLGGSSDTSFLGHMLQINVPQAASGIKELSKALDSFSFLNVMDSSRDKLSTEQLWTLTQLSFRNGPRLSKTAKFILEWPRSSARGTPKYAFGGQFFDCS